MQKLITEKQARQITGGRKPLVPVEYEVAINALSQCLEIEDAKYWSDKADALAAWAKIYRSGEAERKAKQLKLHAYRKMGQLAAELRPARNIGGRTQPGPRVLLMENGLTQSQAAAARKLAKLDPQTFDREISRPIIKSPDFIRKINCSKEVSHAWREMFIYWQSLASFRSFCRGHSASELASGLTGDEPEKARSYVIEIQEWLDEFEQFLPKGPA